MMTWLSRLLAQWAPEQEPVSLQQHQLIQQFDVRVVCTCPCGSPVPHHLSLVSIESCARCGRMIGIRSIRYFRQGPGTLPAPQVSVGYVMTSAALEARPTRGIH